MAGWQGKVKLHYGFKKHQTQVLRSYSQAPFKVQRPFYPEVKGICHSVLVHTAGGMVGGDRLSVDLKLQPKSHVLLTTAAAGKVYRSQGQLSSQKVQISLDSGAILEWFPQETIIFDGALYEQQIQVELGKGAIWCGMELFRFGRTARGEQFRSGKWRSRTEVWHQGQPIWLDRSVLMAETSQNLATLGGYSAMGTLVVVGYEFDKEVIAFLRDTCLPSQGDSPQEKLSIQNQIGITRLPSGLICRYLGHSTTEGRTYFLKIWENLRQIYTGCGICIPRVWQVSS